MVCRDALTVALISDQTLKDPFHLKIQALIQVNLVVLNATTHTRYKQQSLRQSILLFQTQIHSQGLTHHIPEEPFLSSSQVGLR